MTASSTRTANTASERLTIALDSAAARGESWPCRDRDEWTDDDHEVRAAAARECLGCPVSALCAAAADEHGERFGVWAGVDRGPKKPGKNNITARKENEHA